MHSTGKVVGGGSSPPIVIFCCCGIEYAVDLGFAEHMGLTVVVLNVWLRFPEDSVSVCQSLWN